MCSTFLVLIIFLTVKNLDFCIYRLHNDEKMPPEHVPRWHRDPGSSSEEKVRGQAGACHQLSVHVGRRGEYRVACRVAYDFIKNADT